MDGNYKFYFHPLHFIAKVEKAQLPIPVIERIEVQCKCFSEADRHAPGSEGGLRNSALKPSRYRLRTLDKTMTIGNWFYAQGYNYVTVDGKFICDDPYVEGLEREYPKSGHKATLRFMRKEVFQHTVFLVQQGYYYTESGRKILFPDSRPMIENSAFYSQKITLPPHQTY